MADEEDKDQDQANETGEDGEENEDGEEGGKKKGGKKKLLMILVPIILLVGGGAGAYFMGLLDGLLGVKAEIVCEEGDEECEHEKAAAAEHAKDGEKEGENAKKKKASGGHGKKGGKGEEGAGDESVFLAIPTMLVDLNTDDGTPRHLRLTVQLELEDPSDRAEVEAVIPRVIDQFQVFLRELRVRDLRGSAGIYRLQMELLWRVNQATDPIEIKDVLFQEILIQ